ncbi:DUF1707 domain-containing protein [Conexibacter sp. DBS9H8]|uniref:DUF1707 SHOCT-like domain-containing protein n=1 Tax=Conexibacter sp. DBS9H8 TaxID=2937801 RepID=UPI00200F9646|nr:DUF1707 domain-containing protein [Conexibacter sp. DBS9H8]
MARRSSLRASDADRERVAERLREAATEGRILAHELEERLGRAFRAVTYGELDDVVADLPGPVEPRPRRGGFALMRRYPVPAAMIALVIAVTVTAMVAAAVLFALSGAWLLPVVLFLTFRSRGLRRRRARRLGGPGGPGGPGVHVHVHRW